MARSDSDIIPIHELADCDLIIPSRDSRLREISDWLGSGDLMPHVVARIANVITAYELCRQGLGVAIYPAAATDIITDHKSVRVKTISDKGIRASYVLICSAEHPLTNVAQKFVDRRQVQFRFRLPISSPALFGIRRTDKNSIGNELKVEYASLTLKSY